MKWYWFFLFVLMGIFALQESASAATSINGTVQIIVIDSNSSNSSNSSDIANVSEQIVESGGGSSFVMWPIEEIEEETSQTKKNSKIIKDDELVKARSPSVILPVFDFVKPEFIKGGLEKYRFIVIGSLVIIILILISYLIYMNKKSLYD